MSTYAEWLPSLLPAPHAGRLGVAWARAMAAPLDTRIAAAKAAAKVNGVALAPDDALV